MSKRTVAPRSRTVSRSRRSSKRSRKQYIPKSLFGNSCRTTLKYVEKLQLNAGASGIPATYVFTANGLYDPNITGTGHQPRGFDQLKDLYDHYLVTKSTIKVTFVSGASSSVGQIVGIQLQDDSAPEADMIEAMEGRTCSYGPLPKNDSACVKTLSFNSKSFFSINDRLLYGQSNSNPSDQAFYVIFAQPMYNVDPAAIDVMVEIVYDVLWTEPNNLASS